MIYTFFQHDFHCNFPFSWFKIHETRDSITVLWAHAEFWEEHFGFDREEEIKQLCRLTWDVGSYCYIRGNGNIIRVFGGEEGMES